MCNSLDTIYCYATIPPVVENAFVNNDETNNYKATLYVPCESLEAYTAHEVWSLFTNIQCLEDVKNNVENTHSSSPTTNTHKLLHNGQIHIYHNGNTYTIMGQKVSENF
jgi:hypothetical protein